MLIYKKQFTDLLFKNSFSKSVKPHLLSKINFGGYFE